MMLPVCKSDSQQNEPKQFPFTIQRACISLYSPECGIKRQSKQLCLSKRRISLIAFHVLFCVNIQEKFPPWLFASTSVDMLHEMIKIYGRQSRIVLFIWEGELSHKKHKYFIINFLTIIFHLRMKLFCKNFHAHNGHFAAALRDAMWKGYQEIFKEFFSFTSHNYAKRNS